MFRFENMLRRELVSIIKPLHVISCMLCLPKFNLNGDRIEPNTKKYILYSVTGTFTVYYLLITTLSSLAGTYDNIAIYYVYIVAYSQYSINYTILCFFNFFYSKFNVSLILKLQSIDRHLYHANDSKKIKLLVWTACFMLLATYILFVTLKLIYDPLWDWVRGAFIFSALIFDMELTFCIFVAYFLACKTSRWCEVLKYDEKEPKVLQDEIGLKLVGTLCGVYEELLDALVLMGKAAQLTILIHFVIVFVQSITYIEILILMTQNQKLDPVSVTSHGYGVALWISKAVVTEAALCIICETLYRRAAAAQLAVASFTYYYKCHRARRFLKNIQRMHRVRFGKVSACGVFRVDAASPLRLGRMVADYTVILLQFAFLRN